MNNSTLNNGSAKPQSPAAATVESRFNAIEATLAVLKDHLLTARVQPVASPKQTRQVHLDHVRNMLARKGEVTVVDVKSVLGVSVKTATRLMHALNRERSGVLLFDPVGHTERLVLVHPTRVVLERASRSTSTEN
jgi:hypothetical protein